MSTDAAGRSTCNSCGCDVSGNYTDATVVTRLNPETDQVDRLHYCDKDGKGCSRRLVTLLGKLEGAKAK